MLRTSCVSVLAVSFLLLPTSVWGATTVSKKIGFASTASVRPQVRDQCDLQTAIPEAIARNSDGVQLVDGKGTLSLAITDVHAPGGWIFSGPKWVEVKGSLGGKSFRAKRYSAFNPFAGGTCGILNRIARALGSDIAAWLRNPTANAELGDAQ